jgi:hypothetical protein
MPGGQAGRVRFLGAMLTLRRLAVAAGASILATGLFLLARRAADVATFGDTAVIESYTWMASNGDLLLGPYSRFQWHHPGPISFFWIAPFYMLSGARPAGLSAGALALNLAALAILTSIVIRRGSILSAALLASVAVYAWRVAPVLASAWNPHLVVFAMMALIVAAADTVAGTASMLPVVAALASLVGQTHVALLPPALAIGAVAMVGTIVSRWGKDRAAAEISRSLLASIAVVIVLWALPLVEQFTSNHGNISQLWTFFVSEPHRGQRFARAFSAWSDMLTGVVRPDFSVALGLRFRQSPIRWAEGLAVLQMLGLVATAAFAAKARRGFELALASLLILVSLLTLWSATRIEETIFDHEVFWISGVGALNIALMVSLTGRLLADRIRPSLTAAPMTAAIGWALFAVCAAFGMRELGTAVADSSRPSPESEAISTVAKQLHDYFDRERIVRPLVRIDQDAWPLAAGLILRLQKDDVPVAVEDDWIAMFTPAFSATGRETVTLEIDAKPQHVRRLGKPGDQVVIDHDPLLFVHRTTPEPSR